jgi:nucleoside 2-deoxyribosyltransferase
VKDCHTLILDLMSDDPLLEHSIGPASASLTPHPSRVYISGALNASLNLQLALAEYEDLGAKLLERGFAVYLPHHQTHPQQDQKISARDVFEKDVTQIRSSDTVVVFLNEPSFGVGAEIVIAATLRIPIVAIYKKGVAVSRFIRGFLEATETQSHFVEYESLNSVVKTLATCENERRRFHDAVGPTICSE